VIGDDMNHDVISLKLNDKNGKNCNFHHQNISQI